MSYLLLILGFILLIKGADVFVEGSSNIAKFFKIPTIVIGLTLVAFGTSAPEAAVSITAALNGSNDLSIGNILGSNMFNLFCILGITSMFGVVRTTKEVVNKDYLISVFAALLLLVVILVNNFLGGSLAISRIGGIVLLIALIIYLVDMVKNIDKTQKVVEHRTFKMKDVFYVVVGLVLVVGGGQLTVNSATDIARSLGMSETLIGLTICALGTSLPELFTSVIASRKGEEEIAIGNIIGSNIFNILFILGASSLITPMAVSLEAVIDLLILIIGSIFVFLIVLRDCKINKKEGFGMLLFYFIYCLYIFIR